MKKPFIIIGAGGHAKVVIDLLLSQNETIIGLTDSNLSLKDESVMGVKILGNDDVIKNYQPDHIHLALGIGAFSQNLPKSLMSRMKIFDQIAGLGYLFPSLIHPSAIIGYNCIIQSGVQIMAGSIIQPECTLENLCVINTKASIDHDSKISLGAHIAPGVTIGGKVEIGKYSYVGLGASIIQSLTIGEKVTVAAGSVVINDVSDNETIMGVPAKLKS